MDAQDLRRELERLAAIQSDVVPGAFMSPAGAKAKTAAERRLEDDQRSGRLNWRAAGQRARSGLRALDQGDRDLAEKCLSLARGCYTAALEARMKPTDFVDLATSARPRGNKPGKAGKTAERDRQIAEAVEAAEAAGWKGSQAIAKAKRANPSLTGEMSRSAIYEAIARAKRNRPA